VTAAPKTTASLASSLQSLKKAQAQAQAQALPPAVSTYASIASAAHSAQAKPKLALTASPAGSKKNLAVPATPSPKKHDPLALSRIAAMTRRLTRLFGSLSEVNDAAAGNEDLESRNEVPETDVRHFLTAHTEILTSATPFESNNLPSPSLSPFPRRASISTRASLQAATHSPLSVKNVVHEKKNQREEKVIAAPAPIPAPAAVYSSRRG